MEITKINFNQDFLRTIGDNAIDLLLSKNFQALADTFGYALAFGRPIEQAIIEDIHKLLDIDMAFSQISPENILTRDVIVKYYKEDSSGMAGIIECHISLSNQIIILMEFVIFQKEDTYNITLEDFS